MKYLFFIVFFTCLCQTLSSQKLEKTCKGYRLDGKNYNSESEIMQLLVDQPYSLEAYQKGVRYKGNANTFGTLSLLGIGGSILFYSQSANPDGDSPHGEMLFLSLVSVIFASITGTVGLNFNSKANEQKNKRVLQFYDYNQTGLLKPEPVKIKLKMTGQNFGIAILF